MLIKQNVIEILLVEDSLDDANLIKKYLSDITSVNMSVEWVVSCAEAQEMLKFRKFDLILLDLFLPDSFGISTLRKFSCSSTPIIVLTGQSDEATKVSSFKEGIQDFITKYEANSELLLHSIINTIERYRYLSKIKDINDLKSNVLNVVNHEIRTPLSSILGFVNLLITRDLDPDKKTAYLNIIFKECLRMGDMIDTFLDLQKIEDKKFVYDIKTVPAKTIIADSLTIFKDHKDHIIKSTYIDDKISILADYNKLKQVVVNLISNAIKYSPVNSEIIVDVQKIFCYVQISVKDYGIGISSDDTEKLFTKFFRAPIPENAAIKGSGLGLSLCKEIIQAHSGKIWAESKLGEGSTFYFTIPYYF